MNLIPRTLGQSDLNITSVGIGTAPIGSTSSWRIYWGQQDENQAIAWVLNNPGITGAIMGIRNEQEARSMVGGAHWKLTAQEVRTIEHLVADWP
jgi:aryl-alcohol dehydrogenase-like predicted oxidoreductase